MIAIIVEVLPAEGRRDDYLAIAARLREDLAGIEGFVSVERFQSLADSSKMLSISVFEDEDSVMRWRTSAHHRAAQAAGRSGLFGDYRLRVAHVLRDYGRTDRDGAPADSRVHHAAVAPI